MKGLELLPPKLTNCEIVDDTGWKEADAAPQSTVYEREVKFNRELESFEVEMVSNWVRADKCFGALPRAEWPVIKMTKSKGKTAAWVFEIAMDTLS